MRKLQVLLLLVTFFIVQSCKDKGSNSNDSDSFTIEENYPDGTYSADVDYYNPDTGTRNTYTLNVDVESNELVKIHFPSGWLDSSEFSSETLDSDGYCSITCYDGRQFEVQITGDETSYTDEYRMQSDIEDDQAAVTCPECGGDKDEYDDYCYSCKRKKEDIEENTCSRCGGYEYYVNGGLCSSCKSDDEEE